MEYYLKNLGYSYQLSPSRKYWTIIPKGWKKPIRLKSLGEDYTRERILERLDENKDKILFRPFQPSSVPEPQYRLPTREHKLQKVGGLRGLYLYYCYKLGALPENNRRQEKEVSFWLRDDLYQLDKLTAQTDFLCRYQIETGEQLSAHRAGAKGQIEKMTDVREDLWKQLRRVSNTDEEKERMKNEICKLSKQMKRLREEVKLCDEIAERSGIMQDRLQKAIQEERRVQRKEKGYREWQR